jgi:allophanate hydrolase
MAAVAAATAAVPLTYSCCAAAVLLLTLLRTGVVPACAALDCLTVFARSVGEGSTIMSVMEAAEDGATDVWRRLRLALPGLPQQGFRFGVPSEQFTEWDGPGGLRVLLVCCSWLL